MKDFDPRWKDFPDFILGITKEIWEDRGIATLEHYYAPTLAVRSPASVVVGNDGIIAATMATLAEFPDRQLYGEDVIWCDAGDDALLSSHRLYCVATHTGPGMYGAPTGRKLRYRIIADCYAKENQIRDEWLVRDQGAIVRQMGGDVVEWTRNLIEREGGPERCVKPMTPANDVVGPYTGRGNGNEWGARYADLLTRIMSADFRAITQEYDRGAITEGPGHQSHVGRPEIDHFWLGLRASFPSAEFRVEHVVGNEGGMMPPRAALRWSLHGKHDGWGAFGRPTGATVYIMGMCHAEFGPWGVRREFALWDETAIWKQILLQTG